MEINIRNISNDFFNYYEKAKGLNFEDKVSVWKELYENKNRDVFDAVLDLAHIFYAEFKLEDRYEYAFDKHEKVYDKILTINKSIDNNILNTINNCKNLFEVEDGEIDNIDFIVLVGLFMADGWNTLFKGKSTTFFAMDNMPSKQENIDIFLAHEITHGFHTKLVEFDDKEDLAESLFLEGFAVVASEKMVPGYDAEKYLWVGIKSEEGWLDKCISLEPTLKEDIKKNINNTSDEYKALYFGQGNERIPMKAGYVYGYYMIKEFLKKYSFSELIRWDKYKIREEVEKYYL